MIRSLVRERISPRVEALFDRLEQRVTAEDHRAQARRLLADRAGLVVPLPEPSLAEALFAFWRGCLDGHAALPTLDADTASRVLSAPRELLRPRAHGRPDPLDLLTLLPEAPGAQGRDSYLVEALEGTARARPFAEERLTEDGPPATRLLLAAQRAGTLTGSDVAALARALSDGLSAKRWFVRAGTPRGTASLLRCLVAAGAPEAEELLERLLRHVEIRRDEALGLRGSPPRWQEQLERLRFTLALLEGARWRDDLRLLNAALKRNDDHLVALRRRGAHFGDGAPLLHLHYLASVTLQERIMRSLES